MSDPHLLLAHPFSLTMPHRLTGIPSWHEHIPFAFALVAAIQPRVLVELGTYRGDSYCAFCQVVDGLALPTTCYAVDTWQGDDHADRHGEEVFEELRGYHDSRYGRFSRLVRSTFDEARAHFDDGSVDLLHVDGLHTWEAVAHDFESWKAKLSDRAVVLFHDINVREREFGVWRLWKELADRHPGFAFVHGHGLGVLAVGAEAPAEVLALCALPAEGQAVIRDRFAALGSRVGLMGQLDLANGRLRDAETAAAELEQRLRLAEADARILQERLRASEGLLGGLQEELARLSGLIAEGSRGRVDRLVGWIRKKNDIRLAKRKKRREATPPEPVKAPADLEAFARGLELPVVTVPRVSIIIPVFNHLRDTLECLASVVAHTPSNDYEVIVIDDGSTDRSATVLPLVKRLRYLRNETRVGFLVCCNRSAAMARGEYLVFLDVGVRVTPGWLAPMVHAVWSLERVGAAGPMLLGPDGRPREALATTHPDLGFTAVGPGDGPREVQRCSEACLVMRRRHFDAVGGFSEDLGSTDAGAFDLQIKIRKLGLRIIYQPASVVMYRRVGTGQGPPGQGA